MKRTSRRSLFGLAPRNEAPPQEPAASGRTQFSLDEFYRARGPQKLPPIVIRPEVLMHRVPTTAVGSPPPHDAPAVEEQPLYRALCEEQPHDKERSS